QHYFTEMCIRLNESSTITESVLLRLRAFQLRYKLYEPIWSILKNLLNLCDTKNNLSAAIVSRMRNMDFGFNFSGDIGDWRLPGSGTYLVDFFINLTSLLPSCIFKAIESLWNSPCLVFWLEQCLTPDRKHLLPWKILTSSMDISARG